MQRSSRQGTPRTHLRLARAPVCGGESGERHKGALTVWPRLDGLRPDTGRLRVAGFRAVGPPRSAFGDDSEVRSALCVADNAGTGNPRAGYACHWPNFLQPTGAWARDWNSPGWWGGGAKH